MDINFLISILFFIFSKDYIVLNIIVYFKKIALIMYVYKKISSNNIFSIKVTCQLLN